MSKITTRMKRHVRHVLKEEKPTIWIGKEGYTPQIAGEIENQLSKSKMVKVRILPSAHTNPVWVEVAGKPVRASRKSAQWCLDAVDVCWKAKVNQIRESEREAAKAAYDQARGVYAAVLKEAGE